MIVQVHWFNPAFVIKVYASKFLNHLRNFSSALLVVVFLVVKNHTQNTFTMLSAICGIAVDYLFLIDV